jgi:hypothetical protein
MEKDYIPLDIGIGPLSESLLLTGGPMADMGGCREGGRAGDLAAAVKADNGVGG